MNGSAVRECRPLAPAARSHNSPPLFRLSTIRKNVGSGSRKAGWKETRKENRGKAAWYGESGGMADTAPSPATLLTALLTCLDEGNHTLVNTLILSTCPYLRCQKPRQDAIKNVDASAPLVRQSKGREFRIAVTVAVVVPVAGSWGERAAAPAPFRPAATTPRVPGGLARVQVVQRKRSPARRPTSSLGVCPRKIPRVGGTSA